jgi:hypothetical protein
VPKAAHLKKRQINKSQMATEKQKNQPNILVKTNLREGFLDEKNTL